jgi:hypothetical protein
VLIGAKPKVKGFRAPAHASTAVLEEAARGVEPRPPREATPAAEE